MKEESGSINFWKYINSPMSPTTLMTSISNEKKPNKIKFQTPKTKRRKTSHPRKMMLKGF